MAIILKARDIEALEESLADMLDKLEELEAKRDECLRSFTQNASEQEQEFGNKPMLYETTIQRYESFEEDLDEVINNVRQAYNILADRLPHRLHEISKRNH